jgi:lipopolysaccharide export system permease protein
VQPLESLAPWDLVRLVAILRANGLSDHQHRVVLWQQLSIPVAIVGMALLALPLLLGSVRTISAGTRIILGGAVGIGFYLMQQSASHLAGLFGLSPPVMIMTPAVLLLAAAVYAQFLDLRS